MQRPYVFGDVLSDFFSDPPASVCGEFVSAGCVELVDGVYESGYAVLVEVVVFDAGVWGGCAFMVFLGFFVD